MRGTTRLVFAAEKNVQNNPPVFQLSPLSPIGNSCCIVVDGLSNMSTSMDALLEGVNAEFGGMHPPRSGQVPPAPFPKYPAQPTPEAILGVVLHLGQPLDSLRFEQDEPWPWC